MSDREFKEGRQKQGEDERVAYKFLSTPWGTSPSNVLVVVKDLFSGSDVTSVVMPGSISPPVGDLITLPLLRSLVKGHQYRVEIKFDTGGNTLESYFIVEAEE